MDNVDDVHRTTQWFWHFFSLHRLRCEVIIEIPARTRQWQVKFNYSDTTADSILVTCANKPSLSFLYAQEKQFNEAQPQS